MYKLPFYFERGSPWSLCIFQNDLELMNFLPQPRKKRNYRHATTPSPICLVFVHLVYFRFMRSEDNLRGCFSPTPWRSQDRTQAIRLALNSWVVGSLTFYLACPPGDRCALRIGRWETKRVFFKEFSCVSFCCPFGMGSQAAKAGLELCMYLSMPFSFWSSCLHFPVHAPPCQSFTALGTKPRPYARWASTVPPEPPPKPPPASFQDMPGCHATQASVSRTVASSVSSVT